MNSNCTFNKQLLVLVERAELATIENVPINSNSMTYNLNVWYFQLIKLVVPLFCERNNLSFHNLTHIWYTVRIFLIDISVLINYFKLLIWCKNTMVAPNKSVNIDGCFIICIRVAWNVNKEMKVCHARPCDKESLTQKIVDDCKTTNHSSALAFCFHKNKLRPHRGG